jgi:uncharacterized protein (TIGR04255 family)
MTTDALGTWRRPPLTYVVAELAISPYYSLGDRVPALQDRLRSSFPRTLEAREMAVVEGARASAQTLWHLMSADQRHAVHLGVRAISLHATGYQHSADFLGRWEQVLDAVHGAGLGAYVERAGLRYVDLIVPSPGHAPGDYLVEGLRGIAPDGARCTGSMCAAAFQFDGASVNLRAAAPSPQGMLLPPTLHALPLAKPAVMLQAEARVTAGQPIGFVDTDCIRPVGQVLDAGELLGHYQGMQRLASITFKAAISATAREEWM